ncbi:hypothetical protein HII31_08112 [Pseudocercospora fuligena]|uniref:Uncharacterized protein n=1 Tax=Pseudocercospora fuligena TaxID=685502 RepID=A0A8H6RGZ3_9PEZI|nr:hypothetical protein HII31_08112 [Pseudocercospora fuligena]
MANMLRNPAMKRAFTTTSFRPTRPQVKHPFPPTPRPTPRGGPVICPAPTGSTPPNRHFGTGRRLERLKDQGSFGDGFMDIGSFFQLRVLLCDCVVSMSAPSDSKTDKRCRFLELAAELRNRIYEHALVEEHTIAIHRNNITQPGLLRTCRQIREETRSMYYCGNNFKIETGAYDVRPVKMFFKQARGFWSNYDQYENEVDRLGNVEYGIRHSKPPWDRALKWLKAYHDNETPPYVCPHTDHGYGGFCEDFAVAFDMVRAMAPFYWSGIEKVLEKYREVANEAYEEYEDWV